MLLLVLQTSYGIIYLKGEKINEYLPINYYQPLEREKKRPYQLKTNKTQQISSETFPLERLESLCVCANLEEAKFTESHGQPPLDEGGFDFLLFIFHEVLHVCDRQEIRHILIGNYIRKLND